MSAENIRWSYSRNNRASGQVPPEPPFCSNHLVVGTARVYPIQHGPRQVTGAKHAQCFRSSGAFGPFPVTRIGLLNESIPDS